MTNFVNRLWQTVLPKKFLSYVTSQLASSTNGSLKNKLCRLAISHFEINISEAKTASLDDYPTFNHFFTRLLKPNLRPIDSDVQNLASPADGKLSQFGKITQGQLIQAKKKYFTIDKLLGVKRDQLDEALLNGYYATIYLSPKDYHRVHMPIDGKLVDSRYLKGKLFAVNEQSASSIPNLFAVNERMVCQFETVIGVVYVVFVGALLVNGIRVKWLDGKPATQEPDNHYMPSTDIHFKKGDEIGHFQFGSTIILIMPNQSVEKFYLDSDSPILMGEKLAKLHE